MYDSSEEQEVLFIWGIRKELIRRRDCLSHTARTCEVRRNAVPGTGEMKVKIQEWINVKEHQEKRGK